MTITGSRRLALAIGVPLALALIGWSALTTVAWAGQGSYPVRLSIPVHSATATIAVDAGNLRVGPSAGDALRITGTAHYALVRSHVSWSSTSSGVSVQSQCNSPTGPCSFDYQVAVPAASRTLLRDGSGTVTLRALAGPVRVTNSSGDIHAIGLSGAVHIADESGDVSGSALSGSRVVVQNQSGNITIYGVTSKNVSLLDASGDITLTFSAVPDAVHVANQSGSVTLILPHGSTAYNVNASTASGSRTVSVPTNSSSPHVITVTDESGDITIMR